MAIDADGGDVRVSDSVGLGYDGLTADKCGDRCNVNSGGDGAVK